MSETPRSRYNLKGESLALVGIGLTAAALGVSFMSFFVFGVPIERRDALFIAMVNILTRVNTLFIYSSLSAIGSYLLCYVRDLTVVATKEELLSTLGLALFLIISLISLVLGILQLMVTIPMLKGVG